MSDGKQRIMWLDIAKAVGIAAVVVGHTLFIEHPLRHVIFSFHMPLFFILAGWTFSSRPLGQIASKSARRLLVPYVLLFFVNAVAAHIQDGFPDTETLREMALSFVFASGTPVDWAGAPAVGMTWFLVALFLARLTFGALDRLFCEKGLPVAAQGAFWLLFAVCGMFLGNPADILPFAGEIGLPEHVQLPFSYDVAMVSCLFLFVGRIARTREVDSLFSKWWALLGAVAVWAACLPFSSLELAARSYGCWPLCLLGAFAGTFAVCWLSSLAGKAPAPLSGALAWVGRNSMLVYCFHAVDGRLVSWIPLVAEHGGSQGLAVLVGNVRLAMDLALAWIAKKM